MFLVAYYLPFAERACGALFLLGWAA